MEPTSALDEILAVLMPYASVAMVIFVVTIVTVAVFGPDIAELFSRSTTKVAAKLIKGNAVVGYKVASLSGGGFTGVSGGGDYGFVSEGRLNPGFHCFRDIPTLKSSSYISSGSVILEVLLYGEVSEYEDGYIGSNQRVLQIVPNGEGTGYCYSCRRSGCELYLDRENLSDRSFYGYYSYRYSSSFICKPCMKLLKFTRSFTFWKGRPSFVTLSSYFEEANRRSGNSAPIGFARNLDELLPTVLPAESSAR